LANPGENVEEQFESAKGSTRVGEDGWLGFLRENRRIVGEAIAESRGDRIPQDFRAIEVNVKVLVEAISLPITHHCHTIIGISFRWILQSLHRWLVVSVLIPEN
jgi:hypothetical protein